MRGRRNTPCLLVVLCALLSVSCSPLTYDAPLTSCYAMVFEMGMDGTIRPYSSHLRERTLEPHTERELTAVLARERATLPAREGHIAVRARDRWGRVTYRTMVKVVLVGHTICCPHVDFRKDPVVFSIVVPATTHSISFDSWQPASRVTLDIARIESSR